MHIATRFYRLLLLLYPAGYRDAFGAQMLQTFMDQYADVAAPGRAGAGFWLFVVGDELTNIARQRALALRERPTALATVVVAAALALPLGAVFYAVLVTVALALPLPHVGGSGFVVAIVALLVVSAGLSVAASYRLAALVVGLLPKRRARLS